MGRLARAGRECCISIFPDAMRAPTTNTLAIVVVAAPRIRHSKRKDLQLHQVIDQLVGNIHTRTILPKLFFGGKSTVLTAILSFCKYLCSRWNSLYRRRSDHFSPSASVSGTIWISYAKNFFRFGLSLRCKWTRGILMEKNRDVCRLATKL